MKDFLTGPGPLQMALLCVLAWPLALVAAGSAGERAPAGLVTIEGTEIDEASGLARSTWQPGMFWTQNDSGGQPELYAINTAGRHLATLRLNGRDVYNFDWEDVTSFRRNGVGYLMAADIGDNHGLRSSITLYLVREPHFPAMPRTQRLGTVVERTYVLRYPDGPRDAEAIAVDAEAGQIYILSKRGTWPQLYRFDLDTPTSEEKPGVMTALGPIKLPPPESEMPGAREMFTWVTAMSFSDALDVAYVGTAYVGYIYRREGREPWEQTFARLPQKVALPKLPQAEGAAFLTGSSDILWLISEGLPARMGQIRP